jgi:TetR/AcrR family transcriptional regulator
MSEPGSRRGRAHDAERARETILNAAEQVFAEHGFDGARVDAIAAEAGYNKSLIFQYFGDKLGLYAEVIKRADREVSEIQLQVLAPLLANEVAASNAHEFRKILETITRATFDYLAERPPLLRILNWEQAENWQTYITIVSQLNTEDVEILRDLSEKARKAGLLRPGVDFATMLTIFVIAVQAAQSYITSIPMYKAILPDEDFSSPAALTRARELLVDFVVHAIMADAVETQQ